MVLTCADILCTHISSLETVGVIRNYSHLIPKSVFKSCLSAVVIRSNFIYSSFIPYVLRSLQSLPSRLCIPSHPNPQPPNLILRLKRQRLHLLHRIRLNPKKIIQPPQNNKKAHRLAHMLCPRHKPRLLRRPMLQR